MSGINIAVLLIGIKRGATVTSRRSLQCRLEVDALRLRLRPPDAKIKTAQGGGLLVRKEASYLTTN